MSNAPFPIQPELTAVAIAYKNRKMIADDVLPRVTVGKQEFKYNKAALGDNFTQVDDTVGRKSQPNQVNWSESEETSSTVDRALDDAVPQADIDNAPPGRDPLKKSVEFVTNLIELNREVRTASLVFNPATYPAANKTTLSGSSQWSDASSDPAKALMEALDGMIMRGSVLVLGRVVATSLFMHPKICKAVYGNGTDAGIVNRRQLAELLELDDVLVGEGFVNTAKRGQPVNMQRVWGKHAALLYRDSLADAQRGTTFGFTAQWGGRIAGAVPDKDIGMRGGQRVRSGESLKELITAPDLGFFFQNVVA